MPRAIRRSTHDSIPGGTPPGSSIAGRARTTKRKRTIGNGATTGVGKQFLSMPKSNYNIGNAPLTAAALTNFLNQVCETEALQPGYVADHPTWLFSLGERMLGGAVV
jgi:hypothetical protein